MTENVIFHKFVQRDMNEIIRYYTNEAGDALADRFYSAFISTVEKALSNPEYFHPLHGVVRRASISRFPYHFLYRKTASGIRVLVLRHDRRHPNYGMSRR